MRNFNQLLIAVVAAVMVLSVSAAEVRHAENDFNGKWELDTAKTDFGGLSKRYAPTIMTLVQTKNAVTFDRIFPGLPEPSKQTLGLDGKPLEIKKDESQTIRTLQLSEDRTVLTVTSKVHMTPSGREAWDYTRIETYKLGKDGKSLLLTRVSTLPDGKVETIKAFYNRVTTK